MHTPDFSDRARFPSIAELPPADASADSQWWLVAQIKDKMTITQPTLVATDRAGVDFALTLDEDHDSRVLDDAAWRRGNCVAVRGACRTEGRSGTPFVKVARGRAARGDVRVVPGGWDALLALAAERRRDDGDAVAGTGCAVCGKDGGTRCMGCGEVRYCSKDCQAKGWTEGGHKKQCKLFKAIKDIWPE